MSHPLMIWGFEAVEVQLVIPFVLFLCANNVTWQRLVQCQSPPNIA